jgi:hypothetical protein
MLTSSTCMISHNLPIFTDISNHVNEVKRNDVMLFFTILSNLIDWLISKSFRSTLQTFVLSHTVAGRWFTCPVYRVVKLLSDFEPFHVSEGSNAGQSDGSDDHVCSNVAGIKGSYSKADTVRFQTMTRERLSTNTAKSGWFYVFLTQHCKHFYKP